ncbi:MAG: hypothetical protein AAGA80_26820 [Cyanobacteria bacterium P01_F01_bin.143]
MNNKQNFNSDKEFEEDLLAEYNFDYSKAKPNRFVSTQENIIITLEPDVAAVFKTSEDVNKALRAIILAIPKS